MSFEGENFQINRRNKWLAWSSMLSNITLWERFVCVSVRLLPLCWTEKFFVGLSTLHALTLKSTANHRMCTCGCPAVQLIICISDIQGLLERHYLRHRSKILAIVSRTTHNLEMVGYYQMCCSGKNIEYYSNYISWTDTAKSTTYRNSDFIGKN